MRIIISNIFGAKYEEKIGPPRVGVGGRGQVDDRQQAGACDVRRRESETHPALARSIWPRCFRNTSSTTSVNERQADYLRYNPLKYGQVTRVADWPYSAFTVTYERYLNLEWSADDAFGVWRWNDAKGGMRSLSRPTVLAGSKCATLFPAKLGLAIITGNSK